MIKKFYDPAVAEPATTPPEQNSIAALMARHGVPNSTENPVATPILITEKKEETKPAQEPAPVETTTEASIAEKATPETPSQPTVEKADVPTVQREPEPPKAAPTLQEVLRQHQPEAILKELGFDDKVIGFAKGLKEIDPKMVAFLETWKSGGDLTSYLRELTTDYAKMTDEEVMRHQLRREYPTASERALEALFRKEVVEQYNLNSEDEAEKENGQLLLEAKAAKFRASLAEQQQNYLLPKAPEPKAAEPDLSEQRRQQEFEAYQSSINNDPYTRSVLANGQLTIGEGEEKFNFPVKPDALTNILFNSEAWAEKFFTVVEKPDGSKQFVPDARKQMLVAAVLEYGDDFLKEYAKHFKSLGGKSAIESIENAKPPEQGQPSQAEAAPKTIAEAMAKHGRVV